MNNMSESEYEGDITEEEENKIDSLSSSIK